MLTQAGREPGTGPGRSQLSLRSRQSSTEGSGGCQFPLPPPSPRPRSCSQGRAGWHEAEHQSPDSIICTTSFIWLSSRADQTWKLRDMRLEGSCQITFSPARPACVLKCSCSLFIYLFLHDLQLQTNFLLLFLKSKTQWKGLKVKPAPQLCFQPELCSCRSPGVLKPSPF